MYATIPPANMIKNPATRMQICLVFSLLAAFLIWHILPVAFPAYIGITLVVTTIGLAFYSHRKAYNLAKFCTSILGVDIELNWIMRIFMKRGKEKTYLRFLYFLLALYVSLTVAAGLLTGELALVIVLASLAFLIYFAEDWRRDAKEFIAIRNSRRKEKLDNYDLFW